MPRKCRSLPDVEPSSSEGNILDVEGRNKPGQASKTSGIPEKRLAGPSAPPVPAYIRFNANGGEYVGTRTSVGSDGTTAPPKALPWVNGLRKQTPKCPFRHQKCRLCSHPRIF